MDLNIPLQTVAVIFEDKSLSINLYAGTDYMDYDMRPSKYKKNIQHICTFTYGQNLRVNQRITGEYLIEILTIDEKLEWSGYVDNVYVIVNGVLTPYKEGMI